MTEVSISGKVILGLEGLGKIVSNLRREGYSVIAPVFEAGVMKLAEIESADDLPRGVRDQQEKGTYRAEQIEGERDLFKNNVSCFSYKSFLHDPHLCVFKAKKDENGFTIEKPEREEKRFAFFGIRSCDLTAMSKLDDVLLQGDYVDSAYDDRRKPVMNIAVNCTTSADTCFCASMNSGPRARANFDLALTEIIDDERHVFLCEVGSDEGAKLLCGVPFEDAPDEDDRAADVLIVAAAKMQMRSIDTSGIAELLQRVQTSHRFEEIAERCLACANCTMVCPTCFCTNIFDVTDLTGDNAERVRHWDSCFTLSYSQLHGGSVRQSVSARYRQFITHKLGTWHDQFGGIGCVGCGRCIAWCPTGIDITEEMAVFRQLAAP
ncbi:MAG: 4Fe-4S dicluster domain-containing protein [Planctomycetes bacterium]|nr:4Fe-4S dicluster domain-containing protein [Planctomycetota bacterium]